MRYLLLVFLLLTVIAVYIVMKQRLPLKLKRFAGRENLPLERIHNVYYANYEKNMFTEIWIEIASHVEVPPGLLRPTDRFDRELGPVKGYPIAGEMEDLEDAFKRRCSQRSLDWRKVRIDTVDDYVKHFATLQHAA